MSKFITSLTLDKLNKAIEHAEALGTKADKTGDPQDHVAAANMYGQAATIAHTHWLNGEGSTKEERDAGYKMGSELNKLAKHHEDASKEIVAQNYRDRHEKWSGRERLESNGKPPTRINVLDNHGGFTAETKGKTMGTGSLWRPGNVLKGSTQGVLFHTDRSSFYQNNNDVTKATYKVPGYRYPIFVWFDNRTGKRIA